MRTTLDEIKRPVVGEIARYERYLAETLRSDTELAQTMLEYILETRGKGIRPMMVLLSASMLNGGAPLPEDSLVAAMLIEMTHTASLVHDDIIDEADIRRGKPSVKAKWRTSLAVLIGDYILAKTYSYGLDKEFYTLTTYVAHVMTQLCEGEIMQSDQSDRQEMTRRIYDDIIHRKTASLMGRSCGSGAISVGAAREDIERMEQFGHTLGIAFQIKDDILDYSPAEETGKEAGSDIRERKINLPLLYVLDASDEQERQRLTALLGRSNVDPAAAAELFDAVVSRGGTDMAETEVDRYIDEARAILSHYPSSPYRDSLDLLCDYLGGRNN